MAARIVVDEENPRPGWHRELRGAHSAARSNRDAVRILGRRCGRAVSPTTRREYGENGTDDRPLGRLAHELELVPDGHRHRAVGALSVIARELVDVAQSMTVATVDQDPSELEARPADDGEVESLHIIDDIDLFNRAAEVGSRSCS
jgi:hypothetical protein